jgi:hypothetical protein
MGDGGGGDGGGSSGDGGGGGGGDSSGGDGSASGDSGGAAAGDGGGGPAGAAAGADTTGGDSGATGGGPGATDASGATAGVTGNAATSGADFGTGSGVSVSSSDAFSGMGGPSVDGSIAGTATGFGTTAGAPGASLGGDPGTGLSGGIGSFDQGAFQTSDPSATTFGGFAPSTDPAGFFNSTQAAAPSVVSNAAPDFANDFGVFDAPPTFNVAATPIDLSQFNQSMSQLDTLPGTIGPAAPNAGFTSEGTLTAADLAGLEQSVSSPTAFDVAFGPTNAPNPSATPVTSVPGEVVGTPAAPPTTAAFDIGQPGVLGPQDPGLPGILGPSDLADLGNQFGAPPAVASISPSEPSATPGGILGTDNIGSAPPDPGSSIDVLSRGVLGNTGGFDMLSPGVAGSPGGVQLADGSVIPSVTPQLTNFGGSTGVEEPTVWGNWSSEHEPAGNDATGLNLFSGQGQQLSPDQIVAFTQDQSNLLNEWAKIIDPTDPRWSQVIQLVNQQVLSQIQTSQQPVPAPPLNPALHGSVEMGI